MKKLLLIISIFCCSSICFSQEKTANIQIFTSDFERIEIVRLRSGMDLLEGLKEAVSSRKIKNGVILGGIGAVTDYHYHVVSSKNLPPDEEYPKVSVPMDLISVQGYILNGRVHAHIALSDANSVVGGHLESGTKALTFFIITIGVLPDSLKIDNLDNYKY